MLSNLMKLAIAFALIQLIQADGLQIVTRSQWQALSPNGKINNLSIPIPRVIVAHTASGECTNIQTCVSQVRQIQGFHMNSLRFSDIGYNFLVGGDGLVYEGRGWNVEGAHTKGHNKDSICIAFIGNFGSIAPSKQQVQAAQLLLEQGVATGILTPNYKLYGQRQLKATESPGSTLFGIIKSWPHWSAV